MAMVTYKKYGPSTECMDGGEGGPNANEVYRINNLHQNAQPVGCFKDNLTARAIPNMEGKDALLKVWYKQRKDPIKTCYMVAMERNFPYFAIQEGLCLTSKNASKTYGKYGNATTCKNDGKGASSTNQVYKIMSKLPAANCYCIYPHQVYL